MAKNILRLRLGVVAALICSVNNFSQTSYDIRLNQVGYLPNAIKYAAIADSDAKSFSVKTADLSSTVFTGNLSEAKFYTSAEENVKIADFSDFTTSGDYVIAIEGIGQSVSFKIDDEVFVPLSKALVKAFYFNRASTALSAENAGKWARAAGHLDNAVVVHPSAASESRPAGTIISTPYGWYDAGDYNKYVVNSGISTFTLLSAYETYPEYFDTLTLNIPESSNAIPDILDEAWWNIKWLMTMQDTIDGGVYNKTTTASFESTIMPAAATSTRYVITKTTAAALDFAAIMAMTARIYKSYMPGIEEKALKMAKDAWEWAKANPNIPFSKPQASGGYPSISTGSYGDEYFDDEFSWCAAELYISTGDDDYYPEIDIDNDNYTIPNSGSVRMLGLISLLVNRNNLTALVDTNLAKQKLLDVIKGSKNSTITTPYRIPGDYFGWGGNGIYANRGILMLQAFNITKDAGYFNTAVATLDYLLGKNATTYCFVTGQGTKNPRYIHHRISSADGIADPVPGWLAGGPNPGNVADDCGASAYPSTLPARAYLDKTCSYTTNEIAINWNAPMAFLTAGIQKEYLDNFTGTIPPYLIISTNAINFSFKAGSENELLISTNMNWSVSSNVDWLDFSSLSGSSSESVDISVNEENPIEDEREAYVYISSDGNIIDSVYVTQNGKRLNFRIEAEDYTEMFGVQTENTADVGGGLNLGYVDPNDWVDYPIDVSYEGMYEVTIRHAGYAGGFKVLVDGNTVASASVPKTNDWQDWTSDVFEIPLKEGEHTLRFLFSDAGININWFDFQWIGIIIIEKEFISGNVRIYPVPAQDRLTIETKNGCLIANCELLTLDGKKVLFLNVQNVSEMEMDLSRLGNGLYILNLETDKGKVRKLINIRKCN